MPAPSRASEPDEAGKHSVTAETVPADHPDIPRGHPRMRGKPLAQRIPRNAEAQTVRHPVQDEHQASGQCLWVAVGGPGYEPRGHAHGLTDLRSLTPLRGGEQGDAGTGAVRDPQQRGQATERQDDNGQPAQAQQQPGWG